MKPKVTYDSDGKILNIRLKEGKIIDSDIQGGCVFDYAADGQILNIEIMDIDLEGILKSRKMGADIE